MSINIEFEQRAYKRFIAEGMTPEGACGLIGNLEAESDGFYTNRVEYLCLQRLKENGKVYTDKSYTAAIDSGAISCESFLHPLPGRQYGYGLAQWTTPTRKTGLWSLAKSRGVSIADEDLQLDYLVQELSLPAYASVLSTLKTAGSIRTASDAVLKKFERPADTGDLVCAARAARGQTFYNSYIKGVSKTANKTDFDQYYNSTTTHYISNSGSDENGRYSGGAAGDQNGREWCLRSWYSRPWSCVLRHPDEAVRMKLAELAIKAALNDKIGYDQNQRGTYELQLKAAGDDPGKITTACEADCSAGVCANIRAVGRILGIDELKGYGGTYTGDMRHAAQKAGFEILAAARFTGQTSFLLPGDILLNDSHHVATNITRGKSMRTGSTGSGAGETSTSGTTGTAAGGVYMFSVGEVSQGSKGNDVKLLQRLLKSNGYKDASGQSLKIDGDAGAATIYALKAYQKAKGLSVDGCAGEKTWKSILLR